MSKRRKFEKLEYNENYNAAHSEIVIRERNTPKAQEQHDEKEQKSVPSKMGLMLGMDSAKVPEKINPSTKFTYSKMKRSTVEEKKAPAEVAAPPKAPFVLMICVMILMFLVRHFAKTVSFEGFSEGKTAAINVLVNAAVYLLPVLIYILSSNNRKKHYYVKGFSGSVISFAVAMLCFVICFTALQKYFLAYTYSYGVQIGTASKNILFVLLTGAVVPAFFEQIFVHGVFQFEVSKYAGGFCGVIFSALVFAFLQFDIRYFFIFFFIGIVMGSVTHVTRSVIPAMIVRFISCSVSILFSDRIMFIAVERIGGTLLMIILATLCFTFLIVALRLAEGISMKRALEGMKKRREQIQPQEIRDGETDEPEEVNDSNTEKKLKARVEKVDETKDIYFTANEGATLAKIGKVAISPFTLGAAAVFVIELLLKQS